MYLIQIHLKLNQLFKKLGGKPDLHNSLLLFGHIIKIKRILIKILALLIHDVGVKLGIGIFVRIAVLF